MRLLHMNSLKFTRHVQLSLVLGVALALSACSGDGRPLEEAVETNQSNLKTLSVVQPTGLLKPLVVNPGEQINFSIMASTGVEGSAEIPLSAAGRRWSVSDTSRATIDSNGKFIATADGVVNVNLQIGGLTDSFAVTIAQGELTGIAISPLVSDPMEDENTLERCVPEMYTATGTYTDTSEAGMSTRGLQNIVDWRIADEATGIASIQTDGATSVTAFDAGTLDLIATVGNVSSTASISVVDNLQRIDISPDVLGVERT